MVDDSDEDVQAEKPSASAAAGKKKLVKVQVLICTQYKMPHCPWLPSLLTLVNIAGTTQATAAVQDQTNPGRYIRSDLLSFPANLISQRAAG